MSARYRRAAMRTGRQSPVDSGSARSVQDGHGGGWVVGDAPQGLCGLYADPVVVGTGQVAEAVGGGGGLGSQVGQECDGVVVATAFGSLPRADPAAEAVLPAVADLPWS
jgi:hypothetical protein